MRASTHQSPLEHVKSTLSLPSCTCFFLSCLSHGITFLVCDMQATLEESRPPPVSVHYLLELLYDVHDDVCLQHAIYGTQRKI